MNNVGLIGRVLMRLGALLLMRPAATITLAAAFMAAAVPPAALGATVAVIEFYNAGSDHYFRTADQDEASAIDQGNAGPGWARTGDNFLAYVTTSAPSGATDVCRFYGSIVPGPNSHFYTASVAECNALKALALSTPPDQKRWNYEGLAFAATLPAAGGCSTGTTPVYRLYNNGFARGVDSNHRYTTLMTEVARLTAAGWAGEGVVMCGAPAPAANILFIIADDFGLDASPCHPAIGSLKPSMPNLQALCSQGVVFDNAWAYPTCTPTRASVLTGRYGIHTNVMQVDDVLSTSFETILQRVSKAPTPYATAVIGKWHVSGNNAAANSPSLYGAQYYAGFLTGALGDYYTWTLTTNGQTSLQTTYATTVFTDQAINWVSTQTKPWLLWLAYNAPHTPFHVPPAGLHSQQGLTSSSSDRSKYFAAAEALDHEMGRLLASLPTAVRSNTLVVFIGDNGTPQAVVQAPFSRTHAKDSLYEGGIRVPMVVAGAGVTRQGQRVTALVNSTDLFATFSEIARSGTSNPTDSVSFAQALTSATFAGRSHAYMDFRVSGVITSAVRDAQYKLIDFGRNNRELYNLQNDPYEATNLLLPATAATYTGTVNALLARIAEFQK